MFWLLASDPNDKDEKVRVQQHDDELRWNHKRYREKKPESQRRRQSRRLAVLGAFHSEWFREFAADLAGERFSSEFCEILMK